LAPFSASLHIGGNHEHRIIGKSLVLWDHHANLIVDFLPGALTVIS